MCGIAGFSLTEVDSRQLDVTSLASSLLNAIEDRGRHATGAAWKHDDGNIWFNKAPVTASNFVTNYDHVPNNATNAILHTRWATQGSVEDSVNNHPIENGNIIGIHNGVMYNDDAIFDMVGVDKRIGEVDSEAIFALLAHGEMSTVEALQLLEGSAAIAWFNVNEPDILNLARVSSAPLTVARTFEGSLLFASTEKALKRAAQTVNLSLHRIFEVSEGAMFTVKLGRIVSTERFSVVDQTLTLTERHALNVA